MIIAFKITLTIAILFLVKVLYEFVKFLKDQDNIKHKWE